MSVSQLRLGLIAKEAGYVWVEINEVGQGGMSERGLGKAWVCQFRPDFSACTNSSGVGLHGIGPKLTVCTGPGGGLCNGRPKAAACTDSGGVGPRMFKHNLPACTGTPSESTVVQSHQKGTALSREKPYSILQYAFNLQVYIC